MFFRGLRCDKMSNSVYAHLLKRYFCRMRNRFKLLFFNLLCFLGAAAQPVPAAEQMGRWQHLLCDRQVALVVNHSSRVGSVHLVDTLVEKNFCIVKIFAPEHGFRGTADAGEKIRDDQDARTGVPIASLYGKKMKPSAADLEGVECVVFDIQDVGARFYTYISTLFLVMEACAEQDVPLLVLDRPNPNGHYVDGPVLDMQLSSFIGIAPLPIVHGCTVGELALVFKNEFWIHRAERLKLTVIPCGQYSHQTAYDLPVAPSPNLPNRVAVLLYPSLCLFEGTGVSLGRGTDWPFQVLGHPEFPMDSFSFVPRPNAGNKKPFLEGWKCKGWDLRHTSADSLQQHNTLNLKYLLDFYALISNKQDFFLKNNFFDLLAGTRSLRQQIIAGKSEAEIRQTWQADLDAFRAIRAKYLLYPD
jgi:uncharacterized protein YbbC (DUF1343 family)